MSELNKGMPLKRLALNIFCVFLFFNCVFYRDFSHIGFSGVYITEIFIVLISIILLFNITKTGKLGLKANVPGQAWSLLFLAWGSILIIIENSGSTFFKLREYASVLYSIFFLYVLVIFHEYKDSDRIMRVLIFSAFLSIILILCRAVLGLGNITTTEGVIRYGNYEIVGILVLYGFCLVRLGLGLGSKFINIFIIVLSLLVVNFLIAHRSGTLAQLISTLIIVYFLFRQGRKSKARVLIISLFSLVVVIIFSLIYSDLFSQAMSRVLGVFSDDIYNDPNASWRLLTWLHLLGQIEGLDFLLGVGWGYEVPILSFGERLYAEEGFIGVHNSPLFYFFHTGTIGITFLFGLLLQVYVRAFHFLKRLGKTDQVRFVHVLALLSSNVGILFFSLFNVVFEGPYMAIVFWITLALLYNYSMSVEADLKKRIH